MDGINSVGIIGLGYVGLPLVAASARSGLKVVGVDTDETKVDALNSGKSYIDRVTDNELSDYIGKNLFCATTEYSELRDVDVIVICVPTPLKEGNLPDLSLVEITAENISKILRTGHLVILESTTYPGTTDDIVRPILESGSDLSSQTDFLLAYSPEREDPGNKDFSVHNIPKVVGGTSTASTDAAVNFYEMIAPSVVAVESARIAEATKMLENTYRAVNIALVNELKGIFEAMDVDIWQVIEAAKTKPFGFQPFYPGPGMGGHCIPVDPFYLSWQAKLLGKEARFIELAGRINTEMPTLIAERVNRELDKRGVVLTGASVLILGASYKPDVDDDRESPFYPIAQELLHRGAVLSYNDPHIPSIRPNRNYNLSLDSVELTPDVLAAADAVVILSKHKAYSTDMIVDNSKLIIDTRNLTGNLNETNEHIIKA